MNKFLMYVYEIEHSGDLEREFDYINKAGGAVLGSEPDPEYNESAIVTIESKLSRQDFINKYNEIVYADA